MYTPNVSENALDWQMYTVGMIENVHSTWVNRETLLCRNKEWRQHNIGESESDA